VAGFLVSELKKYSLAQGRDSGGLNRQEAFREPGKLSSRQNRMGNNLKSGCGSEERPLLWVAGTFSPGEDLLKELTGGKKNQFSWVERVLQKQSEISEPLEKAWLRKKRSFGGIES